MPAPNDLQIDLAVGAPAEQTFAFEWEPLYLAAAAAFNVRPSNSDVTVTPAELVARFGAWRVRIPRDDIDTVHVTTGYGVLKTIGPPRLSLRDRGITMATNRSRGLCVHARTPMRGIDPLGLIRHPALTVTVDDPEALARALGFPRP